MDSMLYLIDGEKAERVTASIRLQGDSLQIVQAGRTRCELSATQAKAVSVTTPQAGYPFYDVMFWDTERRSRRFKLLLEPVLARTQRGLFGIPFLPGYDHVVPPVPADLLRFLDLACRSIAERMANACERNGRASWLAVERFWWQGREEARRCEFLIRADGILEVREGDGKSLDLAIKSYRIQANLLELECRLFVPGCIAEDVLTMSVEATTVNCFPGLYFLADKRIGLFNQPPGIFS